jgi:hypothetical protein
MGLSHLLCPGVQGFVPLYFDANGVVDHGHHLVSLQEHFVGGQRVNFEEMLPGESAAQLSMPISKFILDGTKIYSSYSLSCLLSSKK